MQVGAVLRVHTKGRLLRGDADLSLRSSCRGKASRNRQEIFAPARPVSVVTFAHLRAGASSDVDKETDHLVQTASTEPSRGLGITLALLARAGRVYTVAGKMFWDYRSVRRQAQRQRVALGLPAENSNGEREPPEVELLWEGAHTRGAARMLQAINDLQGFWVKVGQYLSSRPDIMPQAYLTELSRLQDSAPRRPWSELETTLDMELGSSWRKQFEWVDQTPLGTASIGQVHEGRLVGGQRVAIKIQHKVMSAIPLEGGSHTFSIDVERDALEMVGEPPYEREPEQRGKCLKGYGYKTSWYFRS